MSINAKAQHVQVAMQPSSVKKGHGKYEAEANQKHGGTNDVSFKKLKMGKLSYHCAAGGVAKCTHNTNVCHKNDKNGKLKKTSNQRPKRLVLVRQQRPPIITLWYQ